MVNIELKINKVEHANLVTVLKERDAAKRLGLANDNYTGTTVYNTVMKRLRSDKSKGFAIGNLLFFPKSDVTNLVEEYIERKTVGKYKKDIDALMRAVKRDPSRARELLNSIK